MKLEPLAPPRPKKIFQLTPRVWIRLEEVVQMEIIPSSPNHGWLLIVRSKRGELARAEYQAEGQASLCADSVAQAIDKEWDS